MKKIIAFLLAASILISCQKLFKQDALNDFSIESQSDLENAVAGQYYLTAYIVNKAFTHGVFLGNEDDIYAFQATLNRDLSFPTFYNASYQAILCANDILKKSDGLKKTDAVKKLYGEVYFLRAWCYFNLVRVYGKPPLIYSPDINYNLTKPTYAQVYDSIESDLQRAIIWLPATFAGSRVKYVTPHSGTAKALLAEVLLTRGGYPVNDPTAYKKAWTLAQDIINSAGIYNYALMPDLADLWNGKHNFNPEGVFVLYFLKTGYYGGGKIPIDSLLAQLAYKNVQKFIFDGLSGGYTGVKFYNNFPKQYRKDKTYDTYLLDTAAHKIIYVSEINQSEVMGLRKYYSNVDNIAISALHTPDPSIVNYYAQPQDRSGRGFIYEGNTLYFLRYAHTLLTYAEARARDGQLDATAYEAVNMVRRRANKVDIAIPSVYDLTPNLSTEAFIDSVIWERAWEFCGEPLNRWCDLLRIQATNLPQLLAPYPVPLKANAYHFFNLPDTLTEPGLKYNAK
jgi:hypothetical protein